MSNLYIVLFVKIVQFLRKRDCTQRLWHKQQLLLYMSMNRGTFDLFSQFEVLVELIPFVNFAKADRPDDYCNVFFLNFWPTGAPVLDFL